MTRVIAGRAKGRRLRVPKSGTRPTSDRVRESIFSSLQHYLEGWDGLHVLDLFAGSGALGIEALSRGAASATFIEKTRPAAQLIKANLDACGFAGDVVTAEVSAWLRTTSPAQFDVIFLDPPYADAPTLIESTLTRLVDQAFLAEDAVAMIEHPTRADIQWVGDPHDITTKSFGDTSVTRLVW